LPSQKSTLGERRSLEELMEKYGEENGKFLFEQFNAFRKHYSGLTYISVGVASDEASRTKARAEAEKEGWAFDEVTGTLAMLERLVNGEWDAASFLVVPPGATIRATNGRRNCGSNGMSAKLVRIRLEPLSVEVDVPSGTPFVSSLAAHGFEFPCGGTGLCGGCGVRVLAGSLPVTEADRAVFPTQDNSMTVGGLRARRIRRCRWCSNAASGTWMC
jgi:hypothetical protein